MTTETPPSLFDPKGSYRLLELRVENFKRVEALLLELDAGLNVVSGATASGKSSACDAIWTLLGGGAAEPEVPIRSGHAVAKLSCVIASRKGAKLCTVRYEARRGAASKLYVEDAEGKPIRGPKEFLKALVGSGLAFNPAEFDRPTGEKTVDGRNAKRREMLLRACPVSIDLAANAAARQKAYDDRRDANRDVKTYESMVGEMIGADEAEPKVPDVSALRASYETAIQHNNAIANARNAATEKLGRVNNLARRVAELERQLADARQEQAEAERAFMDSKARASAAPMDVTEIRAKIDVVAAQEREAEAVKARNAAKASARAARAQRIAKVDEAQKAADKFDAEVKRLDAERSAAIAQAKLPAGMAFDENGVTLNGLPYEQASGRERIEAALEVGAASSGALKFILLGDGAGNDYDHDSMIRLHEWCLKRNVQVMAERIDPDVEGAFVLVDGHLAERVHNETK